MLRVEDIHTYYGASHILQGLSLTVERGEVVAVIGRNGVGKTTLVRSIMGLTPPRRGRILFHDADITHLPSYKIARMGMGLVPQGRRIFPSLSVKEHLEVTARARGSGAWTFARMIALFPQLQARLGQTANKLSGGEQQMLAAGRALVGNPDLLLMDEPTEGLAPLMVRELGRLVATLKEAGSSILLVEQQLTFVLRHADRIYIVSRGQVVHHCRPAALAEDHETLSRYLGV
ncbi:MAG TPA: ABC transporter ATP-binding protein [Stellaceae bacterium]|nr:ABC transporter ATP-binding protein [Stellaceae bacterium]